MGVVASDQDLPLFIQVLLQSFLCLTLCDVLFFAPVGSDSLAL